MKFLKIKMDRYLLFACSILMISIPDRFTGSAESFDNGGFVPRNNEEVNQTHQAQTPNALPLWNVSINEESENSTGPSCKVTIYERHLREDDQITELRGRLAKNHPLRRQQVSSDVDEQPYCVVTPNEFGNPFNTPLTSYQQVPNGRPQCMVSRLDFPTIKLDWILDKCQVTSQSNQQSTIISQHSRPQPSIVNCTVNIYRNDKVYPYSGFQSLSSDPNVCRLNESSGGEDAPKALPSVFQKDPKNPEKVCLFSLVSDDKKEPESLSGCEVLLSEPSFAADNESKSQEEECVVVICKSEKCDLPPRVFKGIYLASSRINQQDGVCSVPLKRNLYGNFRQDELKATRCNLLLDSRQEEQQSQALREIPQENCSILIGDEAKYGGLNEVLETVGQLENHTKEVQYCKVITCPHANCAVYHGFFHNGRCVVRKTARNPHNVNGEFVQDNEKNCHLIGASPFLPFTVDSNIPYANCTITPHVPEYDSYTVGDSNEETEDDEDDDDSFDSWEDLTDYNYCTKSSELTEIKDPADDTQLRNRPCFVTLLSNETAISISKDGKSIKGLKIYAGIVTACGCCCEIAEPRKRFYKPMTDCTSSGCLESRSSTNESTFEHHANCNVMLLQKPISIFPTENSSAIAIPTPCQHTIDKKTSNNDVGLFKMLSIF